MPLARMSAETVPSTAAVEPAALARSAALIWEAESCSWNGLDFVGAHCCSAVASLKVTRPRLAESSSPFSTRIRDGLAQTLARRSFHPVPRTRKLSAVSCPETCGARVDPLTVALNAAWP